jgi:hypothetical protein
MFMTLHLGSVGTDRSSLSTISFLVFPLLRTGTCVVMVFTVAKLDMPLLREAKWHIHHKFPRSNSLRGLLWLHHLWVPFKLF